LTVVCYTGFTIEELKGMGNRSIESFLRRIDILIDGRYEIAKKANLLWRGSSNQRVHVLTGAYAHIDPDQAPASMEIVVGSEELTFTGIIDEQLMDRFITHLKNHD
jgi:anaerobic ribonucleoside-triphosphate reductase activating protein